MAARGHGNAYQGMNWIRREKRLAIYLRDGMACAWCGASAEDAERLTLDHLRPYLRGGGHEATNLVTACARCNSSRKDRGVRAFSRAVASYLGAPERAGDIEAHVRRCARRRLDLDAARGLIGARGSFLEAVAAARDKARNFLMESASNLS